MLSFSLGIGRDIRLVQLRYPVDEDLFRCRADLERVTIPNDNIGIVPALDISEAVVEACCTRGSGSHSGKREARVETVVIGLLSLEEDVAGFDDGMVGLLKTL